MISANHERIHHLINKDTKKYSQMCVENNYHIEHECKPTFTHKATYRKMCRVNNYHTENEYQHDFTFKNSQLIRRRKVARMSNTFQKILQEKTYTTEKYLTSAGAMAALLDIGAATSASIYTYKSYNPLLPSDIYSHILQKDTPITNMIFFSAHNAGALTGHGTMIFSSNQTMTVKEILDKTPIRAFDFDIFNHNGELIIHHGNLDPTVNDADITRFKDVLNDINDWLKQNPEEVILLNIEENGLSEKSSQLMSSIFSNRYTDSIHNLILDNNYKTPTIRDLTQNNIQVLLASSHYESAGHANLTFTPKTIYGLQYVLRDYGVKHNAFTYDQVYEDRTLWSALEEEAKTFKKKLEISSIWEDRTDNQFFYKIHPDVAGKLSTDDIDKIISSKKGCVISLDHITPNDPRFFKPEDRETFNLTHDMEIANHSVHGEITDSILTGIGVFTTGARIALSTIISIFHGYKNEMQIRQQSKVISKELSKIEIGEILAARSTNTKENIEPEEELLLSPITVDELKKIYKKNQLFKIIKTTSLPGASATTSISASLLSLGLIFPHLTLTLSSLSVATGGLGIASILFFSGVNAYRLHQAIDESFELPNIKSEFQKRVALMNQEINNKIEDASLSDLTNLTPIFEKIIQDNEITNKLVAASTLVSTISLTSRITGLAKYSLPIMGSISAGVCVATSIFSTSILSTINFKERRKNLNNISTAMFKQVMPNPARKSKLKLGIFGQTAIENFIEKDYKNLLQLLNLPKETSFKDAFCKLMLSENSGILDKYVELFSFEEWNKELIKIAKDVYPKKDFSTIRQNKQQLNDVFKKYMQNKIQIFSSRNTWITGGLGSISIISVGYFSGMLFLPFIGALVTVPGALVAIAISKLAAVRESNLFVIKFKHIINSNPSDLNKEDLRHRKQFDSLLLKWEKLFYQPNSRYLETEL
jgi:hypothetical protein